MSEVEIKNIKPLLQQALCYVPPCPKGVELEEFNTKYQSASLHFAERIKERYSIDFSVEEYNSLLKPKGRKYKGMYTKNAHCTLGILKLKGRDVWTLYNNRFKLFLTVYPPVIADDINEMIVACFARPVRYVAYELYRMISNEINSERIDFDTDKDAAIYYFEKCNYSTLLIDKYKHGYLHPIRFCNEISKILEGSHPKVSISLISRVSVGGT